MNEDFINQKIGEEEMEKEKMEQNKLTCEGRVLWAAKDSDKVRIKVDEDFYTIWSKSVVIEMGDYVEFIYTEKKTGDNVWKTIVKKSLIYVTKAMYEQANPDQKMSESKPVMKAKTANVSSSKPNFLEDMIKFDDLVKMAQDKYKDRLNIDTECLEHNFEKRYATFKATVTIAPDKDGLPAKVITGHGDANDSNVTSNLIRVHYYRMAETRSIARALRFTMNTAVVDTEMSDPNNVKKVDQN